MIDFPGYDITAQLYAGTRTLVYRGIRQQDQQPIVLKLMRSEYPSFSDLVQFRNQYIIAKNLDLPGIIKPYSLENYRNGYALVMEDYGGISLSDFYTPQRLRNHEFLAEFLGIAIQLATILDGLIHQRVIHKDIKPANILIHPTTLQIKLIDFSIASILPRETQTLLSPNVLEGTLAYISPEQTGRMNCGIDYRTDLYSLGITFYELLAGQLPFQSSEPMELVHCHLAQQATPLEQVNVQNPLREGQEPTNFKIPQVVSDIVIKLMAKNAEERYQSALGLKFDLEKCLQQWQETGTISSFALAQRDLCDRFLIPEKLYGREQEVATLLAAFERVARQPGDKHHPSDLPRAPRSELILVAGFSGIGKTAVVNEVHKPIVRQRGYFIRGKFDQFQRNIPFSALVQAFRDLMQQLLTESEARLQQWKTKLLQALGENGQVLIEVIPELERIIGSQPPIPELSGLAAQNRFKVLFQKFIQVFSAPEHPLTLFIDDLQWADLASLNLMKALMSEPELSSLLLLGAYRDNEVSPTHPLLLAVEEIRQSGGIVNTITLAPLSQTALNQFVADTLRCSLRLAQPLAELVFAKTKGNPFFATQFLKVLYEEGVISFNPDRRCWQCDIAQVKVLAIDEDIVEFMAGQLQKLPIATQAVLKLAACIGNQFNLATLVVAHQASEAEIAASLWRTLQEGFILPTSQIYKFFQHEESLTRNQEQASVLSLSATAAYRFLHDRVQQAAYSLIPETQKAATHLKIGQLLLRESSAAEREEKIFEIVNQLNYGSALLVTPAERDELAQLNWLAGSKAKAATAYTAAREYFTTGLHLLDHNSWQQHYELTLKLYESAAEAAYLNGNLEQVEPLAQTVLRQAKTAADKATVYQVQILTVSAQAQLFRGVQIGLRALDDLGIHLCETVRPQEIEAALQEISAQLTHRTPHDLLGLPPMTDISILAAMRILSDINNLSYQSAPQLLPLIMLKQVGLSLCYGNAPDSSLAYAGYGFMLLNAMGEIEAGYEFGQLALNLVERLSASAIRGKMGFLTTVWFTHWKKHANTGLQPSLNSYQTALMSGDLEFAALSLFLHSYTSYHLGRNLDTLQREMAQHHQAMLRLKQEGSLRLHLIHEQLVANLRSESVDLHAISGEYYDEREQFAIHLSRNERSLLCHLFSNKLIFCYWFGDYELAAQNAIATAQYIDGLPSTLNIALFSWYDALTLLARYPQASSAKQAAWMERVVAHQQKMQVWATHAPANFWHKWQLVEAERYRVLGEERSAMEAYDRAIALAKENEYTHEEALANELAARFYLDWGKEKIARVYLTDAYYAYARWGARAKVNDLERRYPEHLSAILNCAKTAIASRDIVSSETSSRRSTDLDLNTILKASQTLSSEIHFDRLLLTLIQLVITNAGANKAALFLNYQGSLKLGIKYFDNAVQSLECKSVDDCQHVPIALIHYVERTLETVITDFQTHVSTVSDPYCLQRQPKSLLCTPILNQGQLVAVLYLENSITYAAFTDERVELLKLLCAQAAISLENARLYQESRFYAHQLEESLSELKVAEAKLQQQAQQLEVANAQLTDYSYTLEQKVEARTAELQAAQTQIIAQEKLASLGALTAGIAHELRNPLNFVNNFAEASVELSDELLTELAPLSATGSVDHLDLIQELVADLKENAATIHRHGQRAASIIDNMLMHARREMGERQRTDLNALLAEAVQLAYHSHRARDRHFNITLQTHYDPTVGQLEVFPSELSRALINLIDNACYSLYQKQQLLKNGFSPTLSVSTNSSDSTITIRLHDNGQGIAPEILDKIFHPFFTTKPTGEGTGLGLSLTHEIIVGQHRGQIQVNSQLGEFAEFLITLPKSEAS